MPQVTLRQVLIAIVFAGLAALLGSAAWIVHTTGLDWSQYRPWLPFTYVAAHPDMASAARGSALLIGLIGFFGFLHLTEGVDFSPRSQVLGDARFATKREIAQANMLMKEGVIVGKLGKPAKDNRRYLRTVSDKLPNVCVVSPPGGGKTSGVVIPSLLTWKGSAIVNDVKGEIFDSTGQTRHGLGDDVYVVEPWAADGRSHSFNPLIRIKNLPDAEDQISELRELAGYLISPKKSTEGWEEDARKMFTAVAMIAINSNTPTIGNVRELIQPRQLSKKGGFNEHFSRLATHPALPNGIMLDLMSLAAMPERTLGSIVSILDSSGLSAWQDPAIQRVTSDDDFSLADLRTKMQTIYFIVPEKKKKQAAPLIRLFFQLAVGELQTKLPAGTPTLPVAFFIDEFHSLGPMPAIVDGLTTARGYGGRFCIITQSDASLELHYSKAEREIILGTCGIQVYTAPNENETMKELSEKLGDITVNVGSRSRSVNAAKSSHSSSSSLRSRRLMSPEEIARIPPGKQIVFIQSRRPAYCDTVAFFDDPYFKAITAHHGHVQLPPRPVIKQRATAAPATPPGSPNPAPASPANFAPAPTAASPPPQAPPARRAPVPLTIAGAVQLTHRIRANCGAIRAEIAQQAKAS